MAGSYCQFCDNRCFVLRRLPEGQTLYGYSEVHMATCEAGKAHDRKALGVDADTATNPATRTA